MLLLNAQALEATCRSTLGTRSRSVGEEAVERRRWVSDESRRSDRGRGAAVGLTALLADLPRASVGVPLPFSDPRRTDGAPLIGWSKHAVDEPTGRGRLGYAARERAPI